MHAIIAEDLEIIAKGIKKEARALEGKTLLISGGAGFLGSYFVGVIQLLNKKFFKKPCRVLSLDNYITASKKSFLGEVKDKNIKHIRADITKLFKVKGSADYVIHAAGLASPVYYQKFPLETIEAAIFGAKHLLEIARQKKAKSFLFFSSSEIYGDPDPNFIPTPESYKGNVSCIGPRACYDESKRLAETLCTIHYQVYGIPVKIVRPFNIYGPGMKPDDYRVIPTFIARALRAQPLPVHGKGNQTRTFCYISDALVGFFKVLLSGRNGEAYNVGNDNEEINMVSLANTAVSILKSKASVQLVGYPESYPADEPNRRCPDLTKIKKELDYKPSIDLKTGLERTARWFKDTLPPEFYLA